MVPVLAPLASPVVLVLDETVAALNPFLAAVFCVCDEDCGGNCCFCGGDCVDGCCCVRSCCLGTPCVERSSGSSPPVLISIYPISRPAGDAIRSCSFTHLIAVARCDTQTFPPSNSDDPSWSQPLTVCLMHTSPCSPMIHKISRHEISSHGSRSSNQTLSDLRIRLCLDGRHSTLVAHLGNPSELTLRV